MILLDAGRVIDPSQKIDGTRTVLIDGERIKEVREQSATPAERLDLPASCPPGRSPADPMASSSPTWPSSRKRAASASPTTAGR